MTLKDYLTYWTGKVRLFGGEGSMQVDRLYPIIMESIPNSDWRWDHAKNLDLSAEGYETPEDGPIQIYSAGLHYGEESQLPIPVGAIFFRKCWMDCTFCSDRDDVRGFGRGFSVMSLVKLMQALQDAGAKAIDLVNPDSHTSYVLQALYMFDALNAGNPKIPVIWNTHGYRVHADAILEQVDIVCLDVKFSSWLAPQVSKAKDDYLENVIDFLHKCLARMGPYSEDLKHGVFVRYLIMPGLVIDSQEVFHQIPRCNPPIPIHIMDQYLPLHDSPPIIQRPIHQDEKDAVIRMAKEAGHTALWIQE